MDILTLNPGGNSLKAELIRCDSRQRYAFEGTKLLSVSIEGMGSEPALSRLEGKKAVSRVPISAGSYGQAAEAFLKWHQEHAGNEVPTFANVHALAVRVVHGGEEFDEPAIIDSAVEQKIIELERLAPLHNKNSVEVLEPLRRNFPGVPLYGVFDTAFHRTMPDYAFGYAISQELAERHQIRRYGFHGISHRYLVERYAHLAGRTPPACNVVSTHLESGCSATAIRQGKSVDNTMGLTPLEGLMMGTRSGDVDPAIVPFLIKAEGLSVEEVMTLLNKKSGLLGVSEISLDTRVLMEEYDRNPRVRLAMEMFAYRLRKAIGSYLAVLGEADAVLFGGGIGENNCFVRQFVCDGLRGFGIEIDPEANHRLIDIEGRFSTSGSRVEAWVILAEEGLEMAHEVRHAAAKDAA